MMKESELLSYALKVLKFHDVCHWRVANGPSIYNVGGKTVFRPSPIAGFPDLAGLTERGRFWAVELKTPKGKLMEHQKLWIARLEKSGAIVRVIRGFDEFLDFVLYLKSPENCINPQG